MRITVCIAAFGRDTWHDLAWSRAYPSASGQGAEVIVLYEREGTVASMRNKAALHAHGEWLIFLDADDELSPGYIEAMERAIDGPGLYLPRTQFTNGSRSASPKFLGEMSLRDGNPMIIGTMVPRDLFFEVGGFTDGIPLFEDWMLFAQLWKRGAEVVKVPWAVYVAHVSRRSRNRAIRGGERIYWHQRIGHSVFPEHYAATFPEEDARRRLYRDRIRLLASSE